MDSTTLDNPSGGGWRYLWQQLVRRTCQPWKQVTFVMYFLGAIVAFGGFGIWVELVELGLSKKPANYDGLYTSIATFYPALIGSASFHLLLTATGQSDKIMAAFSQNVLLAAIICAVLLAVFHELYPTARFFFAIFLALFSIWLWSIADVDNPIYKTLAVDTPSGGSPLRDLKGDTSGFEVD